MKLVLENTKRQRKWRSSRRVISSQIQHERIFGRSEKYSRFKNMLNNDKNPFNIGVKNEK